MTCREDGTFNIEFDDKEIFKEFKVPVSRIRKVSDIGEGDRRRERVIVYKIVRDVKRDRERNMLRKGDGNIRQDCPK